MGCCVMIEISLSADELLTIYDALNSRIDDNILQLRLRIRKHILNVLGSAPVFPKIDFGGSSTNITVSSDENKSIVLRTF